MLADIFKLFWNVNFLSAVLDAFFTVDAFAGGNLFITQLVIVKPVDI